MRVMAAQPKWVTVTFALMAGGGIGTGIAFTQTDALDPNTSFAFRGVSQGSIDIPPGIELWVNSTNVRTASFIILPRAP